MSKLSDAIKHFRSTGSLDEALEVGVGARAPVTEGFPTKQSTQTWFVGDQDKVNRIKELAKDKLPGVTVDVTPNEGWGAGGYRVKFAGAFGEGDVSSLLAGLGGVWRLDFNSMV